MQVPANAAKNLFKQLKNETCIAIWLELEKLIKEYCVESDEDLKRCKIFCSS